MLYFSFHKAKLCFKGGVNGDVEETSPNTQAASWQSLCQVHPAAIWKTSARGFHIGHILESAGKIKILMPGPTPRILISLVWDAVSYLAFWKLSKWLEVCPSLKIIALRESKHSSWTQENWKLVRDVNMGPQLKPMESELWWWPTVKFRNHCP